jgi:LysW-gamma-L-lysine carboxypeptidase
MSDIALIEELISMPSPSGREDAVAEHLVGRMAELGFSSYRDEIGNAVGVVGDAGAQRDIMLVGHMDTVPGFIPVERRNGLLYGRGSVDAKGSLGAFVLAAARVAPVLSSARVVVVGTVQEEADGSGAKYVARTMPC